MRAIYGVIKAAVLLTKIALGAYSKEKNAAAPVRQNSAEPTPTERKKDRYIFFELIDSANEYRAVVNRIETQDIIIPENYEGLPVTELKVRAYCNTYDNKVRLFVPKTVRKIDLDALLHKSSRYNDTGRWIKVIIDEKNPFLVTENRCVYSKDMTVLWVAQCKTNYFTVPETVTEIADHAFTGNNFIVEVKLPPGVTKIGEEAFYGCGNLRKINAENVVSIGNYAFHDCKKIHDFVSEKLHDIGHWCFGCCGDLDTVKLPATVETVGKYVFQYVKSFTFYDSLKTPLPSFANDLDYVIVRSAETGGIKYKVCVDRRAPDIIEANSFTYWKEYAEFNFEEFDKFFKINSQNAKNADWYSREYFRTAAQLRLGYPYKLTDEDREYYKKYLIDNPISIGECFHAECDIADFAGLFREKIKGVESLAKLPDILDRLPFHKEQLKEFGLDANGASELKEKIFLMIEEFCRDGIYNTDDLAELAEIFLRDGKTEYTARIMQLRNDIFPYRD